MTQNHPLPRFVAVILNARFARRLGRSSIRTQAAGLDPKRALASIDRDDGPCPQTGHFWREDVTTTLFSVIRAQQKRSGVIS
jgi:hypothetical protein